MKVIIATPDPVETARQLTKCFGGEWRCEEKTQLIMIGDKPHRAISFYNMSSPYRMPFSRIVHWIITYDIDFEKVVIDSMLLHSKLITPKEMVQRLAELDKKRKLIRFKKS